MKAKNSARNWYRIIITTTSIIAIWAWANLALTLRQSRLDREMHLCPPITEVEAGRYRVATNLIGEWAVQYGKVRSVFDSGEFGTRRLSLSTNGYVDWISTNWENQAVFKTRDEAIRSLNATIRNERNEIAKSTWMEAK